MSRLCPLFGAAADGGLCLAWDESLVAHAFQPAVGTGDWKVTLTRTLESVRYAKQVQTGTVGGAFTRTRS